MPVIKGARARGNIFQRIGTGTRTLIRETIGELRKVSWPTRQEAFNLTKIVIVVMVVMSCILGILDMIYTWFFRLLLGA